MKYEKLDAASIAARLGEVQGWAVGRDGTIWKTLTGGE